MFRGRAISWWAVLAALALIGFAGCDKDSTAPLDSSPPDGNPNLEDSMGGLTSDDEAPAFGDAVLEGSVEAEGRVDDLMAHDPDITRWMRPDSGRVYGVTLLWGDLDFDPSGTAGGADSGGVVTDWSGHLEVNRGAVVVRSTIAFERDDHLALTRSDKTRIEWISHTGTDFDGIRIYVIQPLGDGEDGENDILSIVAGAHEWEFRVNDLDGLDHTETVDDLGNQFSITGILYVPTVCSCGFLGGAWLLPESPDEMGSFQGRWVDVDGQVAGFVRGHYGVNEAGRKVFFGKYIDLDGNFLGFIRGSWDNLGVDVGSGSHHGRMRHHGWFRGDWLDGNEAVLGKVHGNWRSARGSSDGFFHGVWSTGCGRP